MAMCVIHASGYERKHTLMDSAALLPTSTIGHITRDIHVLLCMSPWLSGVAAHAVCSKGYGGPSCAACKPGTYSVGGGAAVCEKVPVCKAATGCAVGQSPACTKVKNLPNGTPCKLAGDLRSEYTCKAGICDGELHVITG